jgi:hypothetical protein
MRMEHSVKEPTSLASGCHVNNMFVIMHKEQKMILCNLGYQNSIHSNIYLTIKVEKDGHFPFLIEISKETL